MYELRIMCNKVKLSIFFCIISPAFSASNEAFENCQNNFGQVIDQNICLLKGYKKTTIQPTDTPPFKINITVNLTSLSKVSIRTRSISFYYTSIGYWQDARWNLQDLQIWFYGDCTAMHCTLIILFHNTLWYYFREG